MLIRKEDYIGNIKGRNQKKVLKLHIEDSRTFLNNVVFISFSLIKKGVKMTKTLLELIINFWYLWVIIILIALYKLFKPKIKGVLGETTVKLILTELPRDKYIVLNDVLINCDHGTTQIDHVVVSVYGLFVIETKNYSGWILGKESDEYWVQSIYGKKNRFKNPIRQNYGHVKALKSLLSNYPSLPINSIIAFSTQCELKVTCDKTPVLYMPQVSQCIKDYSVMEYIDYNTVCEICSLISNNDIKDVEQRKQHVADIKNEINDTNAKIANGICPKCGGKLVNRNGKYGPFVGCSNYPKCRFTIK